MELFPLLKSREWQRPSAKKKPKHGFTLILWSDDAKHSRRLHLSRLAIALAVVMLLGVAVTIGLLVQRTNELATQLAQAQQGGQLDSQREQTMHQVVGTQQQTLDDTRNELSSERQKLTALQSQLGALEQQLSDLEQFSDQVRTMLGGQAQPGSGGQGGQINAPQLSPTPQGYRVELAAYNDDASYRAAMASYQDAILRDGKRISNTRASLEELEAAYLEQTSAQQADDARAQTSAYIQAEQKATQEKLDAAARQAALDAVPHGFPYYGEISSGFGWRTSPFDPTKTGYHPGIDIVADVGTPVKATASGTVISANYDDVYGRMVRIRHPNGLVTLYGHNSKLLVSVGETVQRGDIIAYSGSTGMSTGPHIHYGVYRDGVAVNPMKYR